MLRLAYLVEYVLRLNLMIEICTRTLVTMSLLSPNLPFLRKTWTISLINKCQISCNSANINLLIHIHFWLLENITKLTLNYSKLRIRNCKNRWKMLCLLLLHRLQIRY